MRRAPTSAPARPHPLISPAAMPPYNSTSLRSAMWRRMKRSKSAARRGSCGTLRIAATCKADTPNTSTSSVKCILACKILSLAQRHALRIGSGRHSSSLGGDGEGGGEAELALECGGSWGWVLRCYQLAMRRFYCPLDRLILHDADKLPHHAAHLLHRQKLRVADCVGDDYAVFNRMR